MALLQSACTLLGHGCVCSSSIKLIIGGMCIIELKEVVR